MSLTEEPTRESTPTSSDLDTLESLVKARQTRRDGWTLMVWAFAAVALFASAVAIGFGMRAIDESKDNAATGAAGAGAGAGAAPVTLTEFSITPLMITASQDGGLDITNTGTVEHNLAVQGTDLKTAMIPSGGTAHLDLSGLAAGTYTVFCEVAGHQASGMQAMLHLGAGSAAGVADGGSAAAATPTMTPEQMDQAMKDSITAFPAKTEGLGAQVLAPTILADGTKQFDLTTQLTKWQVSPGKTVEAMTYNGTVPGPTIKVDPGDHVKIVLHNEMPESTSIHFHGLTTPNSMDGTTDVTQDPVKTGEPSPTSGRCRTRPQSACTTHTTTR